MAVTAEMRTQVSQLYVALFGRAPDAEGLGYWVQQLAGGHTLAHVADDMFAVDAARAYYPTFMTNGEIVASFYENVLGRTADAEGLAYWTGKLNAAGATPGSVIVDLVVAVVNYSGTDPAGLTSKALFLNRAEVAEYYGTHNGTIEGATDVLSGVTADPASVDAAIDSIDNPSEPGTVFSLTSGTAAGADVMRLTGDMDARIDLTVNNNQVKGLDLDGDGVIEPNGIENSNPTVLDNGKDFEIVDAYLRDRLNLSNITENFQGDIFFDGTGFGGDGVNTDGNIFLGGLGADLAFGGIGNDFLVGGGVLDSVRPTDTNENGTIEEFEVDEFRDDLHGGRNADFFFAEFSTLDLAEGDNLFIEGGSTTDDSAVGNNTPQDSDWFLIEASDDEEPYEIDLSDEGFQWVESNEDGIDNTTDHTFTLMTEIENIDASGNLYGFLDDVDVALGEGGKMVGDENVGIGSSAQLRIRGSEARNILIGGYDNDSIEGEDGDDLLMGGNLNYALGNPNADDIINDGMDDLDGGDGDDDIVFEADGGSIDGGDDDDTLWITDLSLGTQTAAEMTSDGVLRFELENGDAGGDGNDTFAGYGGADRDDTADQTNYVSASSDVNVDNMENVIATGMGSIDYLAAGTNDPELNFRNQQNHFAYDGDLDLRGTNGVNTLYAAGGNDVLEGRQGGTLTTTATGSVSGADGRDKLSGGDGNDDFYFELIDDDAGDGVDVIHRQHDVGNNITDGTFERDFDIGGARSAENSTFTLGLPDTLAPYVDGVRFTLDGDTYVVDGLTSANFAAWLDLLEAEIAATAGLEDVVVSSPAAGVVVLTDPAGRTFVENATNGWILSSGSLPSDGLDAWYQEVGAPDVDETLDRLIYKAYEDRSDNEGVDDDAVTGSDITLGRDAYAEDLVVDFAADGTRIAEDQSYTLTFSNLTTEDTVTLTVNGVTYTLQVGVSVDGEQEDDEDGVGDTQAGIQTAFLARLAGYINTFMDDDTAAGSVFAQANGNTLTLTQNPYTDGEETVFMKTPTVVLTNESGGERASVTVVNNSSHEVQLLDYIASSLGGQLTRSERDDGSDAAFNADNVLFVGQEFVNRSTLQTAVDAGEVIVGHDALVINGGVDDLADVDHNLATDDELHTDSDDDGSILDENNGNFAVHGDDYLIGGTGIDDISGGTGDDRVRGSRGNDVVDGGKDIYAVRVAGQTQYELETLNAYEASERNNDAEVLDIYLVEQSEEADTMIPGADFVPYFDDTLIFHQADFEAGDTRFTVTLNNFSVGASQIILEDGGAGTVDVDMEGDGDFESTTTFTNFENIRTVSGVSRAVADDGQGNDTLNVSSLSTLTDGIYYDLTNGAGAGQVWADHAVAGWQQIIVVDGVEHVVSGNGDDTVDIDETEAAKDNSFQAGLGDDTLAYLNDFGNADIEPTVTFHVESSANTDTVEMTRGRVGSTVATDTLVSVEAVGLFNDTANGIREDDTLDVTSVTTDVMVDFVNSEVSTDANNDGDFTDVGELLVTIANMNRFENVVTDANDIVLVADGDAMIQARSDSWDEREQIVLDSYLNYDMLDERDEDAPVRLSIADLRTIADGTPDTMDEGDIPEVRNFEQFTFDLGQMTDRVDYSNADDQINAIVDFDADTHYVMVNNSGNPDGYRGAGDRIDALIGTEETVASQGESILDFTAMEQNVAIRYSKISEGTVRGDIDVTETRISIEDLDSSSPFTGYTFVEYYDNATPGDTTGMNAMWTRVEGSDADEYVEMTSDQNEAVHTFNLRGGSNEVNYNELQSTGIDIGIQSIDADGTDAGVVINVIAKDNTGTSLNAADTNGNAVEDGGEDWSLGTNYDRISSYNGFNTVDSSSALRIEASQSDDDTINLTSLVSANLIIVGETEGLDDVVRVMIDGDTEAGLVLTGFEGLLDGAGNDTYRVEDLSNFLNTLALIDTAGDVDTLQLTDGALESSLGVTWNDGSIELGDIEALLTFNFGVLDISEVTEQIDSVSTDDLGETLVLGPLGNFGDGTGAVDVVNFETIEFTSIDGMGADVVVDMDLGEFRQGDGTVLFQFNLATTFDFSAIPDDLTVSVIDTFGIGVTVITDGEDTITGGAGDDTITGGANADTMDGGIVEAVGEVQTIVFSSLTSLGGNDTVAIGLGANTLVVGVNGSAAAGELDIVADTVDEDQLGAALDSWTDADWETELGLNAGDIESVVYDAGSNTLSFNFAVQATDVAALSFAEDNGAATVPADSTANLSAVIQNNVDGDGAAVFESFELNLHNLMLAGENDTFSFAGTTVNLTAGWDSDQVAAAINGGAYVNWSTAVAGDVVTFTSTDGTWPNVDLTVAPNVPTFNNVAPTAVVEDSNTIVGTVTDDATAYAAQGESADTFVFFAGDSTEDAMDSILNFTVNAAGVDDVIDTTNIEPMTTEHGFSVNNGGSGYADYDAVLAAAVTSLGNDDFPFVGSDGTDTWVFFSDNHDGEIGTVIKLVGIDATGIDSDNFSW